jgi:hypothetical protein
VGLPFAWLFLSAVSGSVPIELSAADGAVRDPWTTPVLGEWVRLPNW